MNRKQQSYYTHARTDLLSLVPEEANKILDIGCGEGVLGKQIKQLNKCAEVIGIEKDDNAYKAAAENLDNVMLADIEKVKLPFEENYFDCIIAGDILEHLVEPWKIVERLRYFLKEDGFFLSSMPNVRYYKIVAKLLRGYWDYTSEGILDKTHLRFFCLTNIEKMFQDNGFEIMAIKRNIVSARGLRILNFFFFNKLKEFLTYQYYIVAKKDSKKEFTNRGRGKT